jgi:hypothetical protein
MRPNQKTGDAMSVLDLANELEGQVVERLTELEPLIAEYNQLREATRRQLHAPGG